MSEWASWCKHGVRAPDVCSVCFPFAVREQRPRRRRRWLALGVLGISLLLGAETIPACHVLVRKIQASRHHSKKTLHAWAAWREQHPTWRAPVKTKKETLSALTFACGPVTTLDAASSELTLPSVETPPAFVPADVAVTFPPTTDDSTQRITLAPYFFVPMTMAPYRPTATTPEPTTLMLVGTGLLLFCKRRLL